MIGIVAPLLAIEELIETRDSEIQSVCFHPAGQGVNVARVVCELGEPPTLVGFVGGESGMVLCALLDAYSLTHHLTRITSQTPAVVKLTHGYAAQATYYQPNPIVTRHESDDLYTAASLLIMDSEVVVLSSGLANDMPTDFYARLIRLAQRYPVKTVVDVPPDLLPDVLAAGPTVIKPNVDQLRWIYSLSPTPSIDDLLAVADDLRVKGAGAVVLSSGNTGATIVDAAGAWQLIPPQIEAVVEAGAGDCMVGGLTVGLARAQPLVAAARLGAAAGAAKVMRHGLGSCKRSVIGQLLPRVQVRQVR
jgi:1-phosphofructokinase family hexose kinase